MKKNNFYNTRDRKKRMDSVGFNYDKQPKEYVDDCNLCNKKIFTIISHSDQFGFSAEAVMCNNCGLVMLNPRMTAKAYENFYSNIYRALVSAYHGRLINEETLKIEQKHYAIHLDSILERVIDQKRDSHNLLDIGGSTGVIAHHLKKKYEYKNVTVIDPSNTELSNATSIGLNVEKGTIEDYKNSQELKFDLIICCQTIDHFIDINSALKKIKEFLHPEGIFFFDIVDFRAFYLQNQSIEESIKIDHPYYLTESTTESYLTKIGFKILLKNYAPDHLHVGYVCTHSKPDSKLSFEKSVIAASRSEIRYIQSQYNTK